ncbi:MAG: ComEC/Rec2 family competence protein [Thermomicrobiales bacterium]|nr:ComEC/Rec2 family competence protein [Thermomicrobiales bacterium]
MIGIVAGVGILAGVAFGAWGALAVAASAVAVCAITRTVPDPRTVAAVALLTALGVGRHNALPAAVAPALAESPDLARLVVVSNPEAGGAYQQFVAAAEDDPAVRLCVVARSLPVVGVGDRVSLSGRPGRARDEPLRIQRYLAARGCGASLFAEWLRVTTTEPTTGQVFGRARRAMSESLRRLAPGDAGALLAGLVVGDDSALSRSREDAFANSGTTHLTAVSGANLALIAGMLIALGRVSMGQHRLGWQAVTIGGVWIFALVTGAEPPAVRAAIVATVALLAVRFGRAVDFATLILLAAAVMALVDPQQVNRLGFQLSVAASLALALAMPAFAGGGPVGNVAGIISATTVAQVATLPLLLAVFGTLTVLSIPANALVAPLAGTAMPLAGAAGLLGMVNPLLGEAAVVPASLAADLTIAIADRFGAEGTALAVGLPPLASSFVLAGVCAALVVLLARQPGRRP